MEITSVQDYGQYIKFTVNCLLNEAESEERSEIETLLHETAEAETINTDHCLDIIRHGFSDPADFTWASDDGSIKVENVAYHVLDADLRDELRARGVY